MQQHLWSMQALTGVYFWQFPAFAGFPFMLQLITILNRCHRFPGFVYHQACFSSDRRSIAIAVRPRKGSRAVCSRCHQPGPGYDQCRQVLRSRIEPMKKIARSLRDHRGLILNYFRAQKLLSSGVVEGLNNKAKVTMRKSYGFRAFRCLELALYHSLAKLPRPNPPTIFLRSHICFNTERAGVLRLCLIPRSCFGRAMASRNGN
jgi:Transposase